MNPILILCAADNEQVAKAIASALVEAGEAACVSIVPGIRSTFRWKGEICDEREFLMLIKSSTERFEEVRRRIRQLHTYELPEVVALPIVAGDPEYLNWLEANSRGGATEGGV